MQFAAWLKQRRFRPSLAGTLAFLALLPLLLSLGFWQLRRADEKRALIAKFEAGASTTQQLNADNAAELPLLQTVVASGRYDPGRQILLDNMPSSKDAAQRTRPGYHVLTPLLLNERNIVLIDRGWLPLGESRAVLPDISMSAAALQSSVSVRGRLAKLPRAGLHAPSPSSAWPRVMNFPTLQELRTLYGDGLLPRIVLLDPIEPNGYVREWSTRYSADEFGPEKHLGYAVQWFSFAGTLIVIYLITGLRKRP